MKSDRLIAGCAMIAGLAAMLPMLLFGTPERFVPEPSLAPAPLAAPTEAPSPGAGEDDTEEKGPRNAALRAAAADPAIVALGKENYASFCQACHGAEGSTVDSVSNLFDQKWYHGSRPAEIEWTILKGVLEKGMPGWGEILAPEDTTALTAYLISFQKK